MIGPHNAAVELMAKDKTVWVVPIINAKPYHGQEDVSERKPQGLSLLVLLLTAILVLTLTVRISQHLDCPPDDHDGPLWHLLRGGL